MSPKAPSYSTDYQANRIFQAAGNGPPDAVSGDAHGTQCIGPYQEPVDLSPQVLNERKRGRAGPRHHSQKASRQDDADEPLNESVSIIEPTLAETNETGVDDHDEADEAPDLIDDEDEGSEDVEHKPREMSAKKKKRLQRMSNTMAREAGPVNLTLDVDALVPISSEVTWDQEPELLCCYNWHGAVDGTSMYSLRVKRMFLSLPIFLFFACELEKGLETSHGPCRLRYIWRLFLNHHSGTIPIFGFC